jgi:hypothetical protein
MREKLARLTSNILNPFLLSCITIITLVLKSTTGIADAVKWILISMALSVLPVFAVVLYMVSRKKLDGIFVTRRQQRNGLYLMAGGLAIVGCIILYLVDAPDLLQATFISGLAAIAIFGLINLAWKISLHSAFMSGAATIFTIIYGAAGALSFLLLVLVAWARLELKMHSLAQVVVASILAAAIVTGVFWGFGLDFRRI